MSKIKKELLYQSDVFLMTTGELKYGQEEFIYIKSLTCDNVAKTIKGEYLRLLKIDEEEFEILAPTGRGAYFIYELSNNRKFIDIDGNEVFILNEDGTINTTTTVTTSPSEVEGEDDIETTTITPNSRAAAYDDNVSTFGSSLATVMLKTIKDHMGYHPIFGE